MPDTTHFEILFSDLPSKKADLIVLVLTSQGILSRADRTGPWYAVSVLPQDREKALNAVNAYFSENRFFNLKQPASSFEMSSFQSVPAFTIMVLLSFIHGLAVFTQRQEEFIIRYGASALYILQGEVFRAVTALFLHSDLRHLLGNLAGTILFGAPVISLAGFGFGPLLLLLSGISGNLINAWAYQTAHLSIGASTAVMGGAGILAAYQVVLKNRFNRMSNLMPILAGATLVALFSQGEKTDVWAHIYGFLSGLGLGGLYFPLAGRVHRLINDTQALIIALALVILSFSVHA